MSKKAKIKWVDKVRSYIDWLEFGIPSQKKKAKEELIRMAELADSMTEIHNERKKKYCSNNIMKPEHSIDIM